MTKTVTTLLLTLCLLACAAQPTPTVIIRPDLNSTSLLSPPEVSYDPESGEVVRKLTLKGDNRVLVLPGPPIVDSAFREVRKDLFAIYLFRHAEKQKDSNDPGLTPYGKARAQFLANHLSGENAAIQQVWSSDYQRTRSTALPLSQELGLETRIYDPRNLPEVAETLLAEKADAVVVGHSNTTPDLAAILCDCEIDPMHESNYEQGYIIVFGHGVKITSGFDMRLAWKDRPEKTD